MKACDITKIIADIKGDKLQYRNKKNILGLIGCLFSSSDLVVFLS